MQLKRNIYIILFLLCLIFLINACIPKYPDSIIDNHNFCAVPETFVYEKYNNSELDEKITLKIISWEPELQEHFRNKLIDRMIILKKCESKIKEWEIYKDCSK